MKSIACVLVFCLLFAASTEAKRSFHLRELLQEAQQAVSNATNAVMDSVAGNSGNGGGNGGGNGTSSPAPPASAPSAPAGGSKEEETFTPTVVEAPAPAPVAVNATPTPAKNVMVVMTLGAQEQRDIYQNQQALRARLAETAGVTPERIYFYNHSSNVDKRTGQGTVSLQWNVDCGNPEACTTVQKNLNNPRAQTALQSSFSTQGVTLMPNTTQVIPITSFGRYQGNQSLSETFITPTKPKAPELLPGMMNDTMGLGLGLPGLGMNTSMGALPAFGNMGLNGTMGGMGMGTEMPAGSPSVVSNGPATAAVDSGSLFPAGTTEAGAAGAPTAAGTTPQATQAPAKSSAAGLVAAPLLALAGAAMLLL